MTSKEIEDKLIQIHFKKAYNGFGDLVQEELDYINSTFKLAVTEATVNNGYAHDSEKARALGIGIPYTLDSMQVGQSSTTITLKEVRNKYFNSVNFEFLES